MSKETEKAIDRRVNAKLYEKVNRWKALVADVPALLQRGIEELSALIKSTMKLIAETETRRPKNSNVQWAEQLQQLHSYLLKAREYCKLTGARLLEHFNKFEFCEPKDVERWTLSELARNYRDTAGSLLSEVKFLRELPEIISRIDSEIVEKERYWDQREHEGTGWIPPQATAVNRQPASDQGKQEDKFDVRLV
jgi:hypothetical protein